MNKDNIRKTILENHSTIKELMLSDRQIEIIKSAGLGLTSIMIAGCYDITINNASSQLKKLYDKGYLSREEFISESGGIEYIYKRRI